MGNERGIALSLGYALANNKIISSAAIDAIFTLPKA